MHLVQGSDMSSKAWPRPWIAKYPMIGNNKEFVKGFTDHSASNSDGSRPVSVRFMLDTSFIYEVFEPLQKGGGIRKICKVVNGKLAEVEKMDRN